MMYYDLDKAEVFADTLISKMRKNAHEDEEEKPRSKSKRPLRVLDRRDAKVIMFSNAGKVAKFPQDNRPIYQIQVNEREILWNLREEIFNRNIISTNNTKAGIDNNERF